MKRATGTKPARRRFRFFGDIIGELKKSTWLSRREVFYLTVLVLAMTIAAGVILGALDFGFTNLARVLLGV